MPYPILLLFMVLLVQPAWSQTPITQVISDYAASDSGTTYTWNSKTYAFGQSSGSRNNVQHVVGFTLPGGAYHYNNFIDGSVKIRRISNGGVKGRRSLVWMESREEGNGYNIYPPYTDSMELFFDGRTINKGTDNLFCNQGDASGNNNNIERVDWITPLGMTTTNAAESGFAIFERGPDDSHDPFCVSAITALDASGNPARYGPVLRVESHHYGNFPGSEVAYSILRKEANEPRLYRTNAGTQKRGGVFISFKDLGTAAGEVIYGYSLFANDLPPATTPDRLVDFTQPTYFPTNTASSTKQGGGIDLIAITGLFNTTTTGVNLPVTCRSWEVFAASGKVTLSWSLANEAECRSLILERSWDGQNWHQLAQLDGHARSFTDTNPFAGSSFYRLKLVHRHDGFTYTAVKKVEGHPFLPVTRLLTVSAPDGSLEVRFESPDARVVRAELWSAGGQLLGTKELPTRKGGNRFSFTKPSCKGWGVVRLYSGGAVLTKQVWLP